MNNLFSTGSVTSDRILYTPSSFARVALLHLQEIGELTAVKAHTSRREGLSSYLFFVVMSGSGVLEYNRKERQLEPGDCVFIDCRSSYAHSTNDDLWTLKWCHFYGPLLSNIYDKYLERGGQPVFHPSTFDLNTLITLHQDLYNTAGSADHLRDMRINAYLNTLLTTLLEYSWNPEEGREGKKRQSCEAVKEYLDEKYSERITLEELAEQFHLDKQYLNRCFRDQYGSTINQYLLHQRITKAKQMLRFTDEKLEVIGYACGIGAPHYFSRLFKKIEGMSPSEYRERW